MTKATYTHNKGKREEEGDSDDGGNNESMDLDDSMTESEKKQMGPQAKKYCCFHWHVLNDSNFPQEKEDGKVATNSTRF